MKALNALNIFQIFQMGSACFLLVVYMLCLVEAKPKYVSPVLEAKWQSTPLLLEARYRTCTV